MIDHAAMERVAHCLLLAQRWPDGIVCPLCRSTYCRFRKDSFVIECRSCRNAFSVRTGSVMEKSKLPLFTWLLAYGHRAKLLKMSATEFAGYFGMSLKTAVHVRNRMERWPEIWERARG